MKNTKIKRTVALLTALIITCLLVVTVAPVFAEEKNPGTQNDTLGPDVKPSNKPKPKPTPKPTKKPSPTRVPSYPRPKPKPTPEPNEEHTLTVYYLYEDGEPAAVPYRDTFEPGDEFSVKSPGVPGYQQTDGSVKGKMGHRDMSYVVYYFNGQILTDIDDYDTPLGLGDTVINIGDCYE